MAHPPTSPSLRRKARALGASAAVLTAGLVLSACAGGSDGASTPSTGPQAGGTLVYLEPNAYTSLYAPAAGFYPNGALVNNIADRLVWQDPETLEFEPWLATDWEVNEDATEYTFMLRDDVTFSDGSDLDAAVVAKNFDLYGLGDPERALPVSEAVNNYESSEVIDDHTVTFHFSAPAPGFLQATSTITSGIFSSDTLDRDFEGFAAGSGEEIIGSGPFVITGEELGTAVTLEAREDYAWAPASFENQGRPYVDTVQIAITPENSVRVGSLLSGQGQIARKIEPQDEAQVLGSSGFTVDAPQTNGVNNALNLRFMAGPLDDILVRQAIIAAVDREGVIDSLFTDNYPLATSVLSSTALGYLDTSEYFAYDPEHAVELLEEAGWTEGSDGIRVKDGERLSFTTAEAVAQPRSFDLLTSVAQQLAEVGIEMNIMRATAGDYAVAILDASRTQGAHSMVGRADLDVIKSMYFSANRNILLNRNPSDGAIADPELDALLQAVASEPDPEARVAASQAAQSYLAENAYVLPFFEEPQTYGIASSVQGMDYEAVARPLFSQLWLTD
ncbi:TIGR04028 family ABC transporter substrate-binding protein [Microbacterium sp. E-13]|uniref:TIGR04028 family ABC transporter substrate-binding protein n=1 Tax=Microbacterium sp. E-13 TaxID=3404048 RepID=UPI003CEDEB58